jgi:hypothetical protein
MDIAGVASDLSESNVALNVNLGVLDAVQNLDLAVGAQLAASIGLGATIDTSA